MALYPRTLACAASAMMVCLPAVAQDEGKPAGPDAVELLRQADKALGAVKSLAYTAHSEGAGGTATRSPVVDGKVQARRTGGEDSSAWVFNIQGRITQPGETESSAMHAAFDGTAARSVDERAKVVTEAGGDGLEEVLAPGGGRLFHWLSLWSTVVGSPLVEESDSVEAEYEGRAVVGGVPCEVVRQDTSGVTDIDEYVLWWFLGADDHLPRRLDAFYVDGERSNGVDILTLTDLKPGAEVPDSVLAIATPEGYEVKKVEQKKAPTRQSAGASGATELVGKPAPDWTLRDAAGVEHTLADYRGKVVVLDFWATWCGWCKLAMPSLEKLHEKYQGRGVEVIGIACWETGDPAKYMKDNGLGYGLLVKGEDIAPAYGVQGIPRLVVIGKDGTVVHDATGYDEKAEEHLGAVLDKALEGK